MRAQAFRSSWQNGAKKALRTERGKAGMVVTGTLRATCQPSRKCRRNTDLGLGTETLPTSAILPKCAAGRPGRKEGCPVWKIRKPSVANLIARFRIADEVTSGDIAEPQVGV